MMYPSDVTHANVGRMDPHIKGASTRAAFCSAAGAGNDGGGAGGHLNLSRYRHPNTPHAPPRNRRRVTIVHSGSSAMVSGSSGRLEGGVASGSGEGSEGGEVVGDH